MTRTRKTLPVRQPRARKRKFYVMSFDWRSARAGFRLQNLEVIAPGGGPLGPPPGRRGFPSYLEPPRFLFDRKLGRAPHDLELFHHYSLVSDRTKLVFQAVDTDAFAFLRCDVVIPQGKYDGPAYWLCDVLPMLDALDEANSRLGTARREPTPDDPRERLPSLAGAHYISFREDVVGNACVFRLATPTITAIMCDDVLRDACRAAGLKGIMFRDALKL
jgi:hypothetical protein